MKRGDMPVRCGECTIIYKRVERPADVPANSESTGLCLVCGPRALREADAMPAGALLGCCTGH